MDTKETIKAELDEMSPEELLNLKKFLFEERVRIAQEKEEQKAVYEKILKERVSFREEVKTLNKRIHAERKRLKDETIFFDKKLKILQNGYLQLDMDRKKFARDRRQYEEQLRSGAFIKGHAPDFFRGVNNVLGLKKRYRDLLKIFHPDNLCGDSDTVLEINRQYDLMRKRMGER